MRKLLTFFLVLFLTSPCLAEPPMQLAWMQQQMVAGGGAAAAGCDTASNYIGDATADGATGITQAASSIYCYLATSNCGSNGTATTAYIYSQAASGYTAKVAVYLDDGDEEADTGDTRVAYSSEITSGGSSGWKSAATGGGTVNTAAKHWVCTITPAGDDWRMEYDAGTENTRYATGCSNDIYTTPPANLDEAGLGTCTWASLTDRNFKAYVTLD